MKGLGGMFGKRDVPDAVVAQGPAVLVDDPTVIDDRFRLKCAVWSDGRCLISEGNEDDPEIRAALVALRRRGLVVGALREESVPADDVRAAWAGRSAVDRAKGAHPEVLKQLRWVFQQGAELRASDVVLQNGEGGCQAYVIANDRKLRVGDAMTESVGGRAINLSLYIQEPGSGQTGYQKGSFQGFSIRNRGLDAVLPSEISGLRCQRGPNEPDEDHLYARIFRRDQVPAGMTLEKLGFSLEQAQLFAEVRAAMRGAVFIGGVTGDGKSTTQAVNLMLQLAEAKGELNLVTVEDPVEIPIPGAVQIAVPTGGTGEEREEHYREALRHFCRIHPSSGMVSEIRDSFAARQVLQFADSGHQVWTTIHVATANSILFRLVDLGVSPSEVAKPGNVALLVKQTLVSRLCKKCALPEPPEERGLPGRLWKLVEGWERVRWRNPQGCPECLVKDGELWRRAWAGYERQLAVAETIRPDDGYLDCVRLGNAVAAWKYWIEEMGGKPLSESIWSLVLQGHVDPADAIRKGAELRSGEEYDAWLRSEGTELAQRRFLKAPEPEPEAAE